MYFSLNFFLNMSRLLPLREFIPLEDTTSFLQQFFLFLVCVWGGGGSRVLRPPPCSRLWPGLGFGRHSLSKIMMNLLFYVLFNLL